MQRVAHPAPDSIRDSVRRVELFAALESAQLEAVIGSAHQVVLEGGERLFDHGDAAPHFFLVRDGQVKLFRLSSSGAEKVIEIMRPGDVFAEAVMFMDARAGYPVSADAVTQCELLAFDCAVVRKLLRDSPDTCFRVMGRLSRRLRRHVAEIDRLTLHNATFRLVSYLLDQIPTGVLEYPQVQLTTPKHVIASRLAIQPETFSRLLARLTKQNLIGVDRGSIVLKDIEGLRTLVRP